MDDLRATRVRAQREHSLWRKGSVCAVAAALLVVGSAWAGLDDVRISYSTPGPDEYRDGSPVADGECYALVYTRAGSVFAGFGRDGSILVPEDSELVLAAPAALDGACRPTLFQLPKDYVAARTDGTWQVCLLDTRGAGGAPLGLDADGRPVRVNRYSLPDAALEVAAGGPKPKALLVASSMSGEPTLVATERAPLPKDTPEPRISGISLQDGVATLAVEGTVPYVTYGIAAGRDPTALDEAAELAPQDGQSGRTIEIRAAGTPPTRFFRVMEVE